MCRSCGCGTGDAGYRINGKTPAQLRGAAGAGHGHSHPRGTDPASDHGHWHDHGDGHVHWHDHDHMHDHPQRHDHPHDHSYDHATAALTTAGAPSPRIERDLRAGNQTAAAANRARLMRTGTVALGLASLPGAGTAALLCRLVADIGHRFPVAVVDGGRLTGADADELRTLGAGVAAAGDQPDHGLDAAAVGTALDALALRPGGLLVIAAGDDPARPSGLDLGETLRVVVLPVADGGDEAAGYPDAVAAADLMILDKADLAPHRSVDVGRCLAAAFRANPHLQTLVVSTATGEGMAAFYAWIEARATVSRVLAASA